MQRRIVYPQRLHRGGVSRRDRQLPELDPRTALLDERTPAGDLAFARRLAERLVYYDDANCPSGDWSGLFAPPGGDDEVDIEAIGEVLEGRRSIASLSSVQRSLAARPHFALLLAFVDLLHQARGEMNKITERHLDYYYREVLGLEKRGPRPDRVHVILGLSSGRSPARVGAGTRLIAEAEDGEPLLYALDRDVTVTRAVVRELRSVYASWEIVGTREAREKYKGAVAAMEMLKIPYGGPEPGGELPEFVNFEWLKESSEKLRFCKSELFLEPHEFKRLMSLWRRRQDREGVERINQLLGEVGRLRKPDFELSDTDSRGFATKLEAAFFGAVPSYGGRHGVEALELAYELRYQSTAKAFIEEHFGQLKRFVELMQLKFRIDAECREVRRLLELAGRRSRHEEGWPDWSLPRRDVLDLEADLKEALGKVEWPKGITSLDSFHEWVSEIEAEFELPIESLELVFDALTRGQEIGPATWRQVDELLARAYRARLSEERRQELLKQVDPLLARAYLERLSEKRRPEQIEAAEVTGKHFVRLFSLASGVELEPDEWSTGLPVDLVRWLPDPLERERVETLLTAKEDRIPPVDSPEFEDVLAIAERMEARRLGRDGAVPAKRVWQNLWAHEDATTVGAAASAVEGGERWNPFGRPGRLAAPDDAPPARLGFALSTRQLRMSAGATRRITVWFFFSQAGFRVAEVERALKEEKALTAWVSTADGWHPPVNEDWQVSETWPAADDKLWSEMMGDAGRPAGAVVRFDCALPADFNAVEPLGTDGEDASLADCEPALRWMVEPYRESYAELSQLRLEAVVLVTRVEGLQELRLRSDERELDPAKAFLPFGVSPRPGARLLIHHPELDSNRLASTTVHIDWMGLPAKGIADHYEHYKPPRSAEALKGSLGVMEGRRPHPVVESLSLFQKEKQQSVSLELPGVAMALGATYDHRDSESPLERRRGLYVELGPVDFGHGDYPEFASQKAIELAAELSVASGGVDSKLYHVNPPWTPQIRSISVDYAAAQLISADQHGGALMHRLPFGVRGLRPEPGEGDLRWLPAVPHEGELHIGLEGVEAPQQLSLLFQLADGTGDPDLPVPAVRWSVLSGEDWLDLSGREVIHDGTRGLRNTGVVVLELPDVVPGSLMPRRVPGESKELYWLRLGVERNVAALSEAVSVIAQGALASLVDADRALDHPLPPENIKRFARPVPRVKVTSQPYTSYGAVPAEEDAAFRLRAAEQLRHRGRACTAWDYERLVLERFATIHKAKCVTSAPEEGLSPGCVRVVVIPELRQLRPRDYLEPKAPSDVLSEIQEYLQSRAPLSCQVEVRNAQFVPVKVRIRVRLRHGPDLTWARARLNADLIRYLSPWAFDEGADISFGGELYSTSIINYVEHLDYVASPDAVGLFYYEEGRWEPAEALQGQHCVLRGQSANSVLVSDREHIIEILEGFADAPRPSTGIGHMQIGLDFEVV